MIQFIITKWDEILIAISGIVAGASALAALTPTTKDDSVLAKIKKVLDIFALNIRNVKPV